MCFNVFAPKLTSNNESWKNDAAAFRLLHEMRCWTPKVETILYYEVNGLFLALFSDCKWLLVNILLIVYCSAKSLPQSKITTNHKTFFVDRVHDSLYRFVLYSEGNEINNDILLLQIYSQHHVFIK